jgi:hypothetical protein
MRCVGYAALMTIGLGIRATRLQEQSFNILYYLELERTVIERNVRACM